MWMEVEKDMSGENGASLEFGFNIPQPHYMKRRNIDHT